MLWERLVSEGLLGIRNGLNLDHVGLWGEEDGVLFLGRRWFGFDGCWVWMHFESDLC